MSKIKEILKIEFSRIFRIFWICALLNIPGPAQSPTGIQLHLSLSIIHAIKTQTNVTMLPDTSFA